MCASFVLPCTAPSSAATDAGSHSRPPRAALRLQEGPGRRSSWHWIFRVPFPRWQCPDACTQCCKMLPHLPGQTLIPTIASPTVGATEEYLCTWITWHRPTLGPDAPQSVKITLSLLRKLTFEPHPHGPRSRTGGLRGQPLMRSLKVLRSCFLFIV